MIILLFTISILTYWSLRLMRKAHEQREFSLMFAGVLVAVAAAGIIAAYSLMVGCVGYLGHSPATVPPMLTTAYADEVWIPISDAKAIEDFQRMSEPRF
jgi:ABC-type lipoprotein release transport system permease subunit